MKYAFVDGRRREPEPGLTGLCPGCKSDMVAKCGPVRTWHWAHKGMLHCDHWWENETEWHRRWKNNFPSDWQEVVHFGPSKERHIADVKTPHDLVIEFQHSRLDAQERVSREAFYQKMIWVVDGNRRKRDYKRFQSGHGDWRRIRPSTPLFASAFPQKSLPQDWIDSKVPVLFDFQRSKETSPEAAQHLWCLLPGRASGQAVLLPLERAAFIKATSTGKLDLNWEAGLKQSIEATFRQQNARISMTLSRRSRF
ncbi:competence protein CoiA [Roseovarius confluentis]|uniref:competence protein CoiA n=1 Tax=Roseovarius confluentis TaxID=1852027 RepID=UPI003BA9B745